MRNLNLNLEKSMTAILYFLGIKTRFRSAGLRG